MAFIDVAGFAARIVSIGWAFSSWTKASLLLQSTTPPFRRMSEDDRRIFASYYLVCTFLMLRHFRWLRKRERPGMALSLNPLISDRLFGLALSLTTMTAIAIDELILHVMLGAMFGRKPTAIGKAVVPVKEDPAELCCMICQGTLEEAVMGASAMPFIPSRAIKRQQSRLRLYYFCDSEKHVAHRECISRWVQSRQSNSFKCPVCRQQMRVRIGSVWSAISISTLAKQFRLSQFLSRSLITVSYIFMVCSVMQLLRRKFFRDLQAIHNAAQAAAS